ncbi:GL12952 [Drosophila persimilis]|uniref:GL12952 n=1 Tax=Drosophila persimilis TaxID=7234 RepID=B4GUV6_DROPE|nr:GL12952 [Drosophila persimilis]
MSLYLQYTTHHRCHHLRPESDPEKAPVKAALEAFSDTPQSIRTVATTTSPPKAFLLSAEHLDDASADDRGRVYKLRKKKYPSGGPHIT